MGCGATVDVSASRSFSFIKHEVQARALYNGDVLLFVCSFVCSSVTYENALFSKTKQFRAVVTNYDH